ncbi:MAG: S-ribosylhomocysteine lyase [Bacteroides sp.]
MNKIPSFTIDHNRLLRGIYVSRLDQIGNEFITTFDIRMKLPNREPAMDQRAIHTLEHLVATYLRNDAEWGAKIIYWGPMGCLTGNYLLIHGKYTPKEIIPLLRDAFAFVVNFEGSIPGATPSDCGNYLLHNLELARKEAKTFIEEVLDQIADENMYYPS